MIARSTERKKAIKKIIYELMGSNCVLCGYSKCKRSLHYHHINPLEKNSSIVNYIAGTNNSKFSWEKLVIELRKCTVVCANCHGEIHDGLINQELISSFNEELYKNYNKKCVCGNIITELHNKYCSIGCARKNNIQLKNKSKVRFDWSNTNVIELLNKYNGNMTHAAKEINISDNGIKKRFKKITGFNNWKEYQGSVN